MKSDADSFLCAGILLAGKSGSAGSASPSTISTMCDPGHAEEPGVAEGADTDFSREDQHGAEAGPASHKEKWHGKGAL